MNKIGIAEVKQSIAKELDVFESRFRESMKTKVSLMDTIMTYIVKRKGKQLRPLIVLHSCKIFGEITETTYRGASLVELLHTATLVHDDVVDDSHLRRGFFSINALWKNKVAVLIGDYLLSKGLLLALKNKEYEMLSILSEAVEAMSEGELLQMEKARKLDISEDTYFDIIEKKTASLIVSCCGIGARSSNANSDQINTMKEFGKYAGLAFQIKDDLFDYGSLENIGKPTGIDIKERKMTLPLIYALNTLNSGDKKSAIKIVKKASSSNKAVSDILNLVKKSGGIEYTREKMFENYEMALQKLQELESNKTHYLEALTKYLIYREK